MPLVILVSSSVENVDQFPSDSGIGWIWNIPSEIFIPDFDTKSESTVEGGFS